MKRLAICVLLMGLPALGARAADLDLARNVKRLENIAPDYPDLKDVDKKFLEILSLTEKTRSEEQIYPEAKRIARNATLAQSKYFDSFLYYMLVRSTEKQSAADEVNFWLKELKHYDKSPHLLAAELIRIRQLPKDSSEARAEIEAVTNWMRARAQDSVVRAPEWSGNILFGLKPRKDYGEGAPPKLYKTRYFRSSAKPLDGFYDDETYAALLERIKANREDILKELVTIYANAGKRAEAGDTYYQLALVKIGAKDFQEAKTLLDKAVKLNPEHAQAQKERDRIKLELTYQSLNPPEPTAPEAAAPAAPTQVSTPTPAAETASEPAVTPAQ